MAGAIFSLDGLRGLQDVFGQIPGLIQKPLQRLERDTAFAIRARAQGLAPRDRGDLVNAISAQPSGRSWIVGLLDVTIPSRGGKNSAHLNPSVYGVWYEFGFVSRTIARHPFMKPAAQAEDAAFARGVDQLAREIERAAGQAGGGR